MWCGSLATLLLLVAIAVSGQAQVIFSPQSIEIVGQNLTDCGWGIKYWNPSLKVCKMNSKSPPKLDVNIKKPKSSAKHFMESQNNSQSIVTKDTRPKNGVCIIIHGF